MSIQLENHQIKITDPKTENCFFVRHVFTEQSEAEECLHEILSEIDKSMSTNEHKFFNLKSDLETTSSGVEYYINTATLKDYLFSILSY